jgi:hypothetical protein
VTAPKPGDRVRVVIEAEAHACGFSDTCPDLHLTTDGGSLRIQSGMEASVEVLTPPEPEWEDGDVVIDSLGIAHLYTVGPRVGDVWQTFNGRFHDDTFPRRPLRLLIRDGQVQS